MPDVVHKFDADMGLILVKSINIFCPFILFSNLLINFFIYFCIRLFGLILELRYLHDDTLYLPPA